MLSRSRNLTKIVKQTEINQTKILKEFERLKNKRVNEIEMAENQVKNNVEEKESAWRQLMDNKLIQDAATLTKYYGFGGAGLKYAHCKVNDLLTKDQQKALLATMETSHAIIEQQKNDCHIMDYWTKTEENKMLNLKSIEVKKPFWKFWG